MMLVAVILISPHLCTPNVMEEVAAMGPTEAQKSSVQLAVCGLNAEYSGGLLVAGENNRTQSLDAHQLWLRAASISLLRTRHS